VTSTRGEQVAITGLLPSVFSWPRRLVATQAWKSPWLVTVLETYGGRSATEATVEPPATKNRNQEVKIPDGRLLTGQRDGAMRGTP
jgi:hypothetical protein